MSVAEKTITVDKLEWFYREAETREDKTPVVLLHGIPAHSYTWRGILPQLQEKGFRAIAPDWIGFGFSAKPDSRDFAYTSEAFIQALARFISALELEKVSLVVQGFLGSVGLEYALRYPDVIDRLIILNTPLSAKAKLPWQMKQWGIPFVGDMATQDPLLVDRTLEKGSGFVISDRDLSMLRKPFLQSSSVGRALTATTNNLKLALAMTQIQTGFSQWNKPTQIIWGVEDPWLSYEDAENFAKLSKTIELEKLAEAKHYPQEHWPKEIGETMLNFLRRQPMKES